MQGAHPGQRAQAKGAYVFTLLSAKALECVGHLELACQKLLDARLPQKEVTDEMSEIFNLRAHEGGSLDQSSWRTFRQVYSQDERRLL